MTDMPSKQYSGHRKATEETTIKNAWKEI